MPNPVRPHRGQPTRLPRPWDSPGENTGVGCHLLLQYMKVKSESEGTQLCPTLRDSMDCSPPGSSIHGIFQARVLEWDAIAFSSVIHIHIYIYTYIYIYIYFSRFFSDYYKILNLVPCAIQLIPVVYLFYIW